jgi:short-subunit dehydrogenase
LSIAKVFGANGFDVALVARNEARLHSMVDELAAAGVTAGAFHADLMNTPTVAEGFGRIHDRFGAVDVLEYSPAPHDPVPGVNTIVGPVEMTVENVQPQIEFYLYGAMAAVAQVLPSMLERGAGTLLFSTGASSARPNARMANVGVGSPALRHWALSLHEALVDKGVYVAHVPLAVLIGSGGEANDADTIAETYWDLYTKREEAERLYLPSND